MFALFCLQKQCFGAGSTGIAMSDSDDATHNISLVRHFKQSYTNIFQQKKLEKRYYMSLQFYLININGY